MFCSDAPVGCQEVPGAVPSRHPFVVREQDRLAHRGFIQMHMVVGVPQTDIVAANDDMTAAAEFLYGPTTDVVVGVETGQQRTTGTGPS